MTSVRELINRYFDLAPQPDADAYFAQFTDDATVEDENQTYRGLAAIRAWRTKVPSVAYTLHQVRSASTGHDAAVEIAGDFPGSPVTLTFHFQFAADGRIAALTIRPSAAPTPALPDDTAIRRFLSAVHQAVDLPAPARAQERSAYLTLLERRARLASACIARLINDPGSDALDYASESDHLLHQLADLSAPASSGTTR